jgi:Protein of unknown function (DUF4232)
MNTVSSRSLARRSTLIAAVFLAGATALLTSACGKGQAAAANQSPVTATSPAPSVSASVTASAPASTTPTTCTADELTISIGQPSSAKFQESALLQFRNAGSHPCTLSGRPGLTFAHNGQPMNITIIDDPSVPSTLITLAPGKTAEARLIWNKYEGQGSTCTPRPTTITLTPPGQTTTHTIAWINDPIEGSICGGNVHLTAIAKPA